MEPSVLRKNDNSSAIIPQFPEKRKAFPETPGTARTDHVLCRIKTVSPSLEYEAANAVANEDEADVCRDHRQLHPLGHEAAFDVAGTDDHGGSGGAAGSPHCVVSGADHCNTESRAIHAGHEDYQGSRDLEVNQTVPILCSVCLWQTF